MKTYLVVLTDHKDGPIDHTQARAVECEDHRAAAVLGVKLAPRDHPAIWSIRAGGSAFAWVWDDESPRHDNGAPIIVHGMELKREGGAA